MRNKIQVVRTIVVASALLAFPVHADFLDIDQPLRSAGLGLGTPGGGRDAVGQSFVPSYPLLTAVAVNLQGPVPGLAPDINTAQFTLSVHNAGGNPDTNAPDGPALGSKTVDYNNLIDQGDINSFDLFTFDAPIPVSPGTKYFFKVTLSDPSAASPRWFLLGQVDSNPYTQGANLVFESNVWQYHDGSDVRDLQFRTYGDNLPTPQWIGQSGNWNDSANWVGGVPAGPSATASFLGAITSTQTVYSNTAISVGSLVFDNTNTYVIAGGGSLALDVSSGQASIQVLKGVQKLNLPLIFADDTAVSVSSGATLVIGDPATIKAGKTVTKTGNLSIEAPLTIEAGGSLVLAGPGLASVFGAPALGSGSSVNAQNNELKVDYRGQSSPAAAVRSQLQSGYNNGAWNGAGINTSSAVAGEKGLGWRDIPASESITVKFTYYGDTDLSGTVNSLDFSAFVAGYGQTSAAVWAQGDFNYDGKVDTRDFNLLSGNFGKAPIASPALGAVVPEPGMMTIVGISLAALMRRNRNG